MVKCYIISNVSQNDLIQIPYEICSQFESVTNINYSQRGTLLLRSNNTIEIEASRVDSGFIERIKKLSIARVYTTNKVPSPTTINNVLGSKPIVIPGQVFSTAINGETYFPATNIKVLDADSQANIRLELLEQPSTGTVEIINKRFSFKTNGSETSHEFEVRAVKNVNGFDVAGDYETISVDSEVVNYAEPPEFTVEPGLDGSVVVTVTTAPNNYTDGEVIYRVAWGDTDGSITGGSLTFNSDAVGDNSIIHVEGLTPAQGYWFTVRVDSFIGGTSSFTAPSEYGTSIPCVAAFETPSLSGENVLSMSDEGSPAIFYLNTIRTPVFSNDDYYTVDLVSTEEAPSPFASGLQVDVTGTQQQLSGTYEVSEEFEYYAVATYIRLFAGLEFLASQPSTTANITMP